jgi:hypothetical protein
MEQPQQIEPGEDRLDEGGIEVEVLVARHS